MSTSTMSHSTPTRAMMTSDDDYQREAHELSAVPLLPKRHKCPIATSELDLDDDDDDNREVVNDPYPGVDDGFFDPRGGRGTDVERIDPPTTTPGIEVTPSTPEPPGDAGPPPPSISPRFGSEGGSDVEPDEVDGVKRENGRPTSATPFKPPNFPSFDVEGASAFGDIDLPDLNIYQHRKTLAQGMMDLALFSANANQLRYVLENNRHSYFYPSVVLITFSLLMQVAVGIGLIWNSLYNVKDDKEICKANKINNFTVIGIFLVTVVNVFISAFGVGAPQMQPPT